MSTKPLTLPRWANVGGSIAVPPSTYLDVGHLPNQQPLHFYENWYKNLVYQWIVWLNDGDVAFNTMTMTGAAVFNGNVTLGDASGDTLTVNATPTFNANATFNAALIANGNVTLGDASGDTLTVNATPTFNANVTLNANQTVSTGHSVTLSGTTTLTAGGLITASGGVSANTINGYKFGGSSLAINPLVGDCLSASGSFSAAGTGVGIQLAASSQLFIRLPTFPANTTITGITLNLNVNVGTTNVLNVYYASITNGFAPTSGTLNTITNAFTTGASNQISVIFTPQTLANGQQVWVFIQTSASGTAPIVNSIQITYQQN